MKVYVVTKEIDYEGGSIIGVYDTQEKAKQACEDAYGVRVRDCFTTHYNYYSWEVK